MISLNIEKTFGFISKEKVSAYEAEVKAAQEMLEKGTGKGNDFLGWLHLPSSISKEHLADLNATAKVLRDNCEVVIIAGIGGSYLGARAVIEALCISAISWRSEKKRKFTAIRCIRIRRHCFPQFRFRIRRQKEKEFCLREASHPPTSRRQAANSIPDVQNAWNAAKHRRRSGMKWMTDITYIVIFMIKKEGNSRNEAFYQCRYRGLCRSGTDR